MTQTNETPAVQINSVQFRDVVHGAESIAGIPAVLYDVSLVCLGHEWSGAVVAQHEPESETEAEHMSVDEMGNEDLNDWLRSIVDDEDDETDVSFWEGLNEKTANDAWRRVWESIASTTIEDLKTAESGDLISPDLGEQLLSDERVAEVLDTLNPGVSLGSSSISMIELKITGRDDALFVWQAIEGDTVRFRVSSADTWNTLVREWNEAGALPCDADRAWIAHALYEANDDVASAALTYAAMAD